MNKENDIKVDSFINLGSCYSLDRVSHGSINFNAGNCLVEYNGELYLADIFEEKIYTDEGSSFNFSGIGKHEDVGDITRELGLPWLDEGTTNISYTYIDGIKKIGEDGQLAEVKEDLKRKLKEFISFSMSTCANNYMSYDEEYYELYGEYKDISIDSSLEQMDLKGIDFSESDDSIKVSKDTMPYGKINATLKVIDNNLILHLNGKEYNVNKLRKNVQPITKTKRTPTVTKEQQELIDVLFEQYKKIEDQKQEIAELKVQRRSFDE